MKFVYALLLSLFLFSFGCTNKNNIPSDILPEDSMVNIIVDMHIGDAILMQPKIQTLPYVINKQEFYYAILKKHSLTHEIFEKNMNFYASKPEEYNHIYERVIEELSYIQGTLANPNAL